MFQIHSAPSSHDDFLLRAVPTTPGGFQIGAISKLRGGFNRTGELKVARRFKDEKW
jgi:hypothetical protein